MSTAGSALLGLGCGLGIALAATPLAIGVARRTGFLDRPRQYRKHSSPTPFLGGAAAMVAFLAAALAVGAVAHFAVLLIGLAVMAAIGTIDDRVAVSPGLRLLAETTAAGALWVDGLGWRASGVGAVDLALTIVWCVGLVNAFNLMDNMDGACGTVASVSCLGLGALAVIHGDAVGAGMAFALVGALVGFLRFNVARPARIFLGDGGSMPVGFVVAGLGMASSRGLGLGDAVVPVIALLAGVVILDTTLVSVSRTRRRVSLLTGGRDHLTHRLLARVGSPRRVCAVLAAVQACLCGLAVLASELGVVASVLLAASLLPLAAWAVAELDSSRWRPAGIASAPPRPAKTAMRSAEHESVPAEAA